MSSRIHDEVIPASNKPKAKILNFIVCMFFVSKKNGKGAEEPPAPFP